MALFKSIPPEVIDMMKKLHIIVLVVALIVFFVSGFTAAISVVLGALCVTSGIILSAPVAYRAKGDVTASKVVTDALKGELVKILTIIATLAGVFIFITAIVPMFIILGLAIAAIFSGLAISKVDIK
jgi:ATP synthase protein I